MEKRLLLFLAITFGIILVYYQIFPPPTPPKKPGGESTKEAPAGKEGTGPAGEGTGKPAGGEPGKVAKAPTPGEPEKPAKPAPAGPERPKLPEVVAPGLGKSVTVDTPTVRWVLDTWGGSVRAAYLKRYARKPGQDLDKPESWYPVLSDIDSPDVFRGGRDPYRTRSLTLAVLSDDGEVAIPLSGVLWDLAESGTDRVLFRLPVPAAGVVFEKEIRFPDSAEGLPGGAYHATVVLRMKVTDPAAAARYGKDGLHVRFTGPGGVPTELNSYGSRGTVAAVLTRDVVSPEELKGPDKPGDKAEVWPEPEDQGQKRLVEWASVHSRFFAAILKPEHPSLTKAEQAVVQAVPDRDEKGKAAKNLSVGLDFTLPYPAAGEGDTVSRSFLLYAGPMDPDTFEAPPYATFAPIIDYGWFGSIAKILVFLLGVLHSVVLNWGVAIIVLTLLVRFAMFPLSRKQQFSMQRYQKQMARLKPKIDALKERYGKNRKKMQEEQMKLFREEGVRMFPAGCLVMFLQFPIFIGLFQALRYSIGLRHSAFLWAKDLTAPDQLAGPFRTGSIPLVPDPFYLNLLPILMAVTWWLSSALQPKPTDPQQQQTMKIMQFMPIIFSLLLYSYPAGLALYMVVSSSWSIFEVKMVRRMIAREEQAVGAVGTGFRKGK